MADEVFDIAKEISEITDPKALRVIVYLLKKIEILEEKIARLEKNSSNSSKPPSSDNPNIGSSDITKPESEQRQPGKRKIGGQPRHDGKTRALLPPESVTVRAIRLEESSCRKCGASFTGSEQKESLVQQTIELREDPIEVTEYRRAGCRCGKCGEKTYANLPDGVIEDQICGPRLQALLAYMKGNHGASYTDLCRFCADVLSIEISRSTLCDIIKRVSGALEDPYNELLEYIREEEALNIDESGWKDSGARYWVWVFCTKLVALFSIQKSRGCIVLNAILGDAFTGTITSDFYGAYISYASKNQQFCLAHLIRDIKFLTTLPQVETKIFGEKILEYFRKLFKLWHGRDQIPRQEFLDRCDKLQRKLFTFLTNSNLEKGAALTMKKRLIKTWESLFRFVEEPTLYQPTNNLAEQTIRAVVRIRNNTQGTRSEWGRTWNSRIFSVLATCKKQSRSPFHFILQAIKAHKFSGSYPSLLPT